MIGREGCRIFVAEASDGISRDLCNSILLAEAQIRGNDSKRDGFIFRRMAEIESLSEMIQR